jgi:hypothetical protein
MNENYGNEVYEEIRARGEWGSFFNYSQYQRLKRTNDPAIVIEMAMKNGYRDLYESMSPSELVESLLLQGSEIAERKDIWIQAMVLNFFDPIMTIMWVVFDKMDRRLAERGKRKEYNQKDNKTMDRTS